jgi:CheY-like chemotaxis protein
MLAGADHDIAEAKDGEHALAAVAKERPDLILMEIQTRALPIGRRLLCEASRKSTR